MALKLLVIGDLHGAQPMLRASNVDAILAVGDFCSDAPKKLMFEAMERRLAHGQRAQNVRWWDIIGRKQARALALESLADGRAVLEQLNGLGVPVLAVPGNWDWTKGDPDTELLPGGWERTKRGLDNIIDVHFKKIVIHGITLIGYGVGSFPEYPQTAGELKQKSTAELRKRKKLYVTSKEKLSSLFSAAAGPTILLSHNVPYGTKLDIAGGGPRGGQHVGSAVVRDIIKRFQPLLSVGGHVHENQGQCLLGRTICVNAGFRSQVLLELARGRLNGIRFLQ